MRQSSTLATNHELGSHRATLYRVYRDQAKTHLATFQESSEAVLYCEQMTNLMQLPHRVVAEDYFQHGNELRLYLEIKPTAHI